MTAAHLAVRPATLAPGEQDRAAGTSATRAAWPALALLAMICWVIAAIGLRSAAPAEFGLLQAASPLLLASLLLTLVSFVVALRARSWLGTVVSIGCLIVIERVSTLVGTDVPLYPWTYKHLAVVSYIQRYGGVTRGLDIYNQWPGLFSTTAWLSDLTGVAPITIAHWFTPVIHVLGALAVYALARAWRSTPLHAATATFLWEALSFIAQDYFSPQALAYLLGIGVLSCLGLAREHKAFGYLSILPFAALTLTHQLSPYWILLTAVALLVTRRLRPWWIAIAYAVIAVGYLYWNYAAVKHYGGAVSGNVASNVFPSAQTNDVFASQAAFRLTEFVYAVVFLSAAVSFVIGLRRKQDVLGPACFAFVPVLLLLAQSYGGEAIFRVFLFALPGACVLIAPQLIRLVRARVPILALASVLLIVTSVAAAQSYFSGWFAYRVTPAELAANGYFAKAATGPSYLTSVPPGWPSLDNWQYAYFATQQANYNESLFANSSRIHADLGSAGQYEKVMTLLEQRKKLPTYLMLSDRSQYYGWFLGTLPRNAVDRLDTQVSHDKRWTLAFRSGDVMVYRLVG